MYGILGIHSPQKQKMLEKILLETTNKKDITRNLM